MVPFLNLGLQTQELRSEIDQAIGRVLDSGRYIGGEEVERFEREFASLCCGRYAVGTGNGLDALALMLRAYGIGPGDEVIVPSNTYIATWLAISMVGARIVPVEADKRTYNLDPSRVENAVTPKTRAILAVHLYGRQADMTSLRAIAQRANILLLEDAAQAHGIQTQADASAFSFYPSKNLGALGDGGAVVTNDPQIAERVRVLGNYGSREKYFNIAKGVNSRLDPLQAAVLRVKLNHLVRWNQTRSELAQRYTQKLAGVTELVLPTRGLQNVWHIFAIRHKNRDHLAGQLKAAGIDTLIHYPQPPHLSTAYANLGFKRGDFPLAEEIADTELSLPLHPQLTAEKVEEVAEAVIAAVTANREGLDPSSIGARQSCNDSEPIARR